MKIPAVLVLSFFALNAYADNGKVQLSKSSGSGILSVAGTNQGRSAVTVGGRVGLDSVGSNDGYFTDYRAEIEASTGFGWANGGYHFPLGFGMEASAHMAFPLSSGPCTPLLGFGLRNQIKGVYDLHLKGTADEMNVINGRAVAGFGCTYDDLAFWATPLVGTGANSITSEFQKIPLEAGFRGGVVLGKDISAVLDASRWSTEEAQRLQGAVRLETRVGENTWLGFDGRAYSQSSKKAGSETEAVRGLAITAAVGGAF